MSLKSRGWMTLSLWAGVALLVGTAPAQELKLHPRLKEIEAKRVAVIEKVKPSVVAIFGPGGNGGGSGVLISEDGFALTNYHVTAGAGNVMKCGLPDGKLYDAVLVGQDKVGDVALVKLFPREQGKKFPFAPMGDSDKVRAGDWSLAMGNPFLLATDFTPTVTFGLISGVHRYQYPAGTLLEYTDCIQIDTSINPGNSGGPLFNMQGEIIGINGRGSFEKRTRINSGVGYAISINQIKNFMGHLKAGLDVDHASLGALIESESDDGGNPKMVVRTMIESDASRRGLEPGDELVMFAGRPMTTVNQFKNTLGLYPRGWRVPLTYRRDNKRYDILVRLMGVQKQSLEDPNKRPPQQPPRPGPRPINSPVSKYFEAKPGFANHYYNREERNRLWKAFTAYGDFSKTGEWTLSGDGEVESKKTTLEFNVREVGAKVPVRLRVLGLDFEYDATDKNVKLQELEAPPKSGGLISALYIYRHLLTMGEKGFEGEYAHGGHEPFYPLPEGNATLDPVKDRMMCEVLRTRHAGMSAKFYFALNKERGYEPGMMVGFELILDRDKDPCEIYLDRYAKKDGRTLPGRLRVKHGDRLYAEFTGLQWKFFDK